MFTSIQFNDEFTAWRAKIYDVIANRVLAAKTDAVYLIISQA